MENIVQWFIDALNGISGEWTAFIISMIPVLELRGGLIAAKLMNVDILTAVPLCILGNLLPVPFILWFVTPLFTWLKKSKLLRPMVEKLEKRAMSTSAQIEKG